MSRETRLIATGSQTVGPFFHFGLTDKPDGRMIDRFTGGGTETRLRITVRDGDGQPVGDAMIELWQSGVFGRMPTDASGSCEFQTVRPETRQDGSAGHINVCLFARGLLRQLHTRIYFAGDPDLERDPVFALVPVDRQPLLLASPVEGAAGPRTWKFVIRLQGERETPFFDL